MEVGVAVMATESEGGRWSEREVDRSIDREIEKEFQQLVYAAHISWPFGLLRPH